VVIQARGHFTPDALLLLFSEPEHVAPVSIGEERMAVAASELSPGVISPDDLYTLEALKRQLGIKDATLRAARRAGLRVHYKHGRGFVLGADWIAYVCSPNELLESSRSTSPSG